MGKKLAQTPLARTLFLWRRLYSAFGRMGCLFRFFFLEVTRSRFELWFEYAVDFDSVELIIRWYSHSSLRKANPIYDVVELLQ